MWTSVVDKSLIFMKLLGTVIKSATDRRMYKAVQLTNKLECLIISDSEAEKSSSSMSVGAGSFQDPLDVQGLAHYLEHMLFMGTEKHPSENDYRYGGLVIQRISCQELRELERLYFTRRNKLPP